MKILIHDDNPGFGGHQIMACRGAEALAADPANEIVFIINPANNTLAKTLKDFRVIEGPCSTRRIRELKPDLLLCIQGDIQQSTQGVRSAKRAGIECVSYLAVPHSMKQMGAKLGSLRDHFSHGLLNAPDRYVAISESMKQILVERGVVKPISVVPNGIPIPPAHEKTVRSSQPTLGLLGRIEFKQKQQDFMVRTFSGFPMAFHDCRLLIAGDGPDEARLQKLAEGHENITLMPWMEDKEAFYRQIDFLVIPSRFEGVPLVMLEALARGIPVLASACDGMKDTLPETWTFEPGNGKALADTFSRMRDSGHSELDVLQRKILAEHSIETFNTSFRKAVCGH